MPPLAEFEKMRSQEPPEVVTYTLLNGLVSRTFRIDRQNEAVSLFEANRSAFPDSYFTFESLTEALHGAGVISRDEAIRRYEGWLEEHPGHPMAEVQRVNLRRR